MKSQGLSNTVTMLFADSKGLLAAASWHQFQVLTKRSHRLAEVNKAVLDEFGSWPENLWLGGSVCSPAKMEMQRIEDLGGTAAALKRVSFEPWVSDLNHSLRTSLPDLRSLLRQNGIAWTVIGGESGSRDDTNLMTLDDARYLVEESKAGGCRVHFKQLGTALTIQRGVYSTNGEHRAKGGSPDQWPEPLNVREWPEASWRAIDDVSEFTPAYDSTLWEHYSSASLFR
jgi:protein gp37